MLSFNSFSLRFVSIFSVSIILTKILNLWSFVTFAGALALLLWLSWISTDILNEFVSKKSVDTKGKVVLITGCDTGFGHSAAKVLHRSGFKVVATCLNSKSVGALALNALSIKTIELNVTNDSDIRKTKLILEQYLKETKCELWAIVNNAGVFSTGIMEWGDLTDLKRMLDINVIGLVMTTRYFLPLIRKSQGRIVNVASVAGRVSLPGLGCYSMSKHAVIAFSDALRREMKVWNIKVITIEPMAYRTGMANLEYLSNSLLGLWERTPPEIQTDYGSNYFHTFRERYVLKNARGVDANTNEVVSAITDSVINVFPKISYKCRSKAMGLVLWILETLPYELTDNFFKILTYFWVKPRMLDPDG